MIDYAELAEGAQQRKELLIAYGASEERVYGATFERDIFSALARLEAAKAEPDSAKKLSTLRRINKVCVEMEIAIEKENERLIASAPKPVPSDKPRITRFYFEAALALFTAAATSVTIAPDPLLNTISLATGLLFDAALLAKFVESGRKQSERNKTAIIKSKHRMRTMDARYQQHFVQSLRETLTEICATLPAEHRAHLLAFKAPRAEPLKPQH